MQTNVLNASTLKKADYPTYGILLDMDHETLKKVYHDDRYAQAYADIRNTLSTYGLAHQQGGLYFGESDKVNAVVCVIAVTDLTRKHPWFAAAVKSVRMLRIEENADLLPAVRFAMS